MAVINGYKFPDDLYYHQEHSWARIEGEGNVRVGMNDFFQKQAGEIVFVDLPEEGDEVSQGEICGNIQSSKWVGKLYSPLSGRIMKTNEDLLENVTAINTDPYGEGWIMVINPSNLNEELNNLIHGDRLITWVKGEIEKAERLKKR